MVDTELSLVRDDYANEIALQKDLAQLAETEGRNFTDEEIVRYDNSENKAAELKARIATLERVDKVKGVKRTTTYTPAKSKADPQLAIRAWLTRNKNEFREEYGAAADELGFKWRNGAVDFKLRSKGEIVGELIRSNSGQSRLSDAAGKYAVNDCVVNGFERALQNVWSWSNLVTTTRTAGGAPYAKLCNNDTSNEAEYLDELDPIEFKDTTFSRVRFDAYKISTAMFVSNEELEDAAEDVGAIIGYNLGERIARKLEKEFTVGDGQTGHIRGFTLDSHSAGDTHFQDALTYDDFVNLFYSLPEPYRNSPGRAWQMHSLVIAELVKSIDEIGRPLYQAQSGGMNEAPRMVLLGAPIVANDNLSSTFEQGEALVYFGAWDKYNVRIARDLQIRTSTEQKWREDAVAVGATMRVDGKIVNAGTHPIQHLVLNTASGAPHVGD